MRASARVEAAEALLLEEWDRFADAVGRLMAASREAVAAKLSKVWRQLRARAYLVGRWLKARIEDVVFVVVQTALDVTDFLLGLISAIRHAWRFALKNPSRFLFLCAQFAVAFLIAIVPIALFVGATMIPAAVDVLLLILFIIVLVMLGFTIWALIQRWATTPAQQRAAVEESPPGGDWANALTERMTAFWGGAARRIQQALVGVSQLKPMQVGRGIGSLVSSSAAAIAARLARIPRLRVIFEGATSGAESGGASRETSIEMSPSEASQTRKPKSNWSLDLLSWSKNAISYFSISILSISWGSISILTSSLGLSIAFLTIAGFTLTGDDGRVDGVAPQAAQEQVVRPPTPLEARPPPPVVVPPLPPPTVANVSGVFDEGTAYYWVVGSDTLVRREAELVFAAPFPAWTFQSNGVCGHQLIIAYGTASSDGSVEANLALAKRRATRLAGLVTGECQRLGASPIVIALAVGEARQPLPTEDQRVLTALALAVENIDLSTLNEDALGDLLQSNDVTVRVSTAAYRSFAACSVSGATSLRNCDET